MNYFIAIGGTGVRCMESMIHLCAAGLGPDQLFLFTIDADEAQGNVNRTTELIETYGKFRENFQTENLRMFRTRLLKPRGSMLWSPLPLIPQQEKTFSNLLNYEVLEKIEQKLCKVLFTDGELAMDLSQGFRGHTVVGSTTLALMDEALKEDPWASIINKINGDTGAGKEVKVFVCGSIFGGTGASGVPTVGQILDKEVKQRRDMFRLACACMLPYFRFEPSPQEIKELGNELFVHADDFILNARAALEHYSLIWEGGKKSPYHYIYFIGDNQPLSQKFAVGGPQQQNDSNYVELLSSLAALHFFNAKSVNEKERKKFYSGPQQENYTDAHPSNVVKWTDLPLKGILEVVRNRLLTFTCFGYAYTDFFLPLIKEKRFHDEPECSPWYMDYFDQRLEDLGSAKEIDKQSAAALYFERNYYPWLKQVLNSGDIQIFSKDAIVNEPAGEKLVDMLPEVKVDKKRKKKPFDRLWEIMCKPNKTPNGKATGKMLNMLYDSVDVFCKYVYSIRERKQL